MFKNQSNFLTGFEVYSETYSNWFNLFKNTKKLFMDSRPLKTNFEAQFGRQNILRNANFDLAFALNKLETMDLVA